MLFSRERELSYMVYKLRNQLRRYERDLIASREKNTRLKKKIKILEQQIFLLK